MSDELLNPFNELEARFRATPEGDREWHRWAEGTWTTAVGGGARWATLRAATWVPSRDRGSYYRLIGTALGVEVEVIQARYALMAAWVGRRRALGKVTCPVCEGRLELRQVDLGKRRFAVPVLAGCVVDHVGEWARGTVAATVNRRSEEPNDVVT